MDAKLMDPLAYYEQSGKAEHDKNVGDYFDELLEKSGVDQNANRETVRKYNEQVTKINELNSKISKYKLLRGFLIFVAIAGIITAFASIASETMEIWLKVILAIVGIGLFAGMLVIIFVKVNKILKNFDEVLAEEKAIAQQLLDEAWAQVSPLLSLFDDYDTLRLVEKTIPDITFDKQWTISQLETFRRDFMYVDMIDEQSSVIDTLSGKMFGNPFLFERYVHQDMGTQTYTGSLRIEWVTYETDSNGNTVTKRHSETLHASVTKPKPYYETRTLLHFGHQAAPDLSFTRDCQHIEKLTDKEIEKKVASGEKKIQKKARQALKHGEDFTEMANSRFDVLFGALDRDNEQQFRILFTPLAQTGMVNLMRSRIGYGDDFFFMKRGKVNIISSEHAQSWDMDTSATKYYSYDIDEIRAKFHNINNKFFKSIFFDFAPIITIPAYQHEPSQTFEDVVTKYDNANYTTKEHEAMANRIGTDYFAHESTVTDVILKTEPLGGAGDVDNVLVTAHSFAGIERVDFIPVRGGDGNYHNVPVPWIEYIPIEKCTEMSVKNINMSNTEFNTTRQNAGVSVADTSACFHGLFAYAHTPDSGYTDINTMLSGIIKKDA